MLERERWVVTLLGGSVHSGGLSRYSPVNGTVILDGSDRVFRFEDCVSIVSERAGCDPVDEIQRARDFLADARKRRLFAHPPERRVWE